MRKRERRESPNVVVMLTNRGEGELVSSETLCFLSSF